MVLCFCFHYINVNEQVQVETFSDRQLVSGPASCVCILPWYTANYIPVLQLKLNEYARIDNLREPERNKYVYGPIRYSLESPWEEVVEGPLPCPVLDQDDYIVVTDKQGIKRNVRGPGVYKPVLGDRWSGSSNSIQVPVNCYMIVQDANNPEHPVHHVRGPLKFFPEPFQTVEKNPDTRKEYFPCIEVTRDRAVHLQRADGTVILLSEPQFYMPEVGERVLRTVERVVLLQTDFCILKSPDGHVSVMRGTDPAARAFFVQPFHQFETFHCPDEKKTLSTLPTFLAHKFSIRTSDNVVLELDVRVSYQIQDVDVFAANPIDFYPYIRNFIQNELLDAFAHKTLREYMSSFSTIAQGSAASCSEKQFRRFGIEILDVQILNYVCTEKETQRLLDTDIQTNVVKQNELRARQNDILIQEEVNKVQIKQKELEVEIAKKDNEVALKRKMLENDLRLKEMEIEIAEEHQRTNLLEVRRNNDLLEAEFVGRARGHEFKEFLNGLDPTLTTDQKIQVWLRQCDLLQASLLYSKVKSVSMLPPGADVKLFTFGQTGVSPGGGTSSEVDEAQSAVADGLLRAIGATTHGVLPTNSVQGLPKKK